MFKTLFQLYIRKRRQAKRKKWLTSTTSKLKSCGQAVEFRFRSTFIHPSKIIVGNNVWIGENGWFQGIGGISIGNSVVISRNCTVFSGYHDYQAGKLPYDDQDVEKPVVIGDNVWVGMNVNIVPGVTIGEGAIIGMGTTVTGDVPPLAIIGSSPHRILKYRDRSHYERLKNEGKVRDVTKA